MKGKIILAVFLFTSLKAISCDVCALFAEITPNAQKSRIGYVVRNRLNTGLWGNTYRHGELNANLTNGILVRETFQNYELRGRVKLSDRFFINVNLPIKMTSRVVNDTYVLGLTGISDPFLMGNYNLVLPQEDQSVKQRFSLGFGVKAPIGSTVKQYNGQVIDLDYQPGTGSWDFIAQVEEIIRVKDLGFSLNVLSRFNGWSKAYQFGISVNLNTHFFYNFSKDKNAFMPFLGMYSEFVAKDKTRDEIIENSGGNQYFISGGGNVVLNKFNFRLNYQHAVVTKINGYQIPTKSQFTLGVFYNF